MRIVGVVLTILAVAVLQSDLMLSAPMEWFFGGSASLGLVLVTTSWLQARPSGNEPSHAFDSMRKEAA